MGLISGIYRALGGKPNTPDVDDDGALLVRGTLAAVGDLGGLATETTLAAIKALLPTALGGHGGLVVEGVASGTPVPVTAASLPLPADAATQTTLAALLGRVPASIASRIPVDGSGVTQPVSAASLPLPTGAATDRTTAAAPAAVRLSADGTNFASATHPVFVELSNGSAAVGTPGNPLSVALPTAGAAVVKTNSAVNSEGDPWTQLPMQLFGSSVQHILLGTTLVRQVRVKNVGAVPIYVYLFDKASAPVNGDFTSSADPLAVLIDSILLAVGSTYTFDYEAPLTMNNDTCVAVSTAINSMVSPAANVCQMLYALAS